MRRFHLLALAAFISLACSAPDVRDSAVPPPPSPPSPGQLALNVPNAALRPGSNTLYFNIVRYDGTWHPKALTSPLNKAQVTVRLLGDGAPPSTVAEARFIKNGPSVATPGGDRLRTNYVATLKLPASGAGVLEFLLEDQEESRRIEIPVRVSSGPGEPVIAEPSESAPGEVAAEAVETAVTQ
jgi:hypothetical protein